MAQIFVRDPDSIKDYGFNWANWLATGETIVDYDITVETGLTLGTGDYAPSESDGVVTVWLSGGTHGERYAVDCKITTSTSPPRVEEDSIIIIVRESNQ